MNFSLVICTYQRPDAICTLLDSVDIQSKYPDEILIIDGSIDDATQDRFHTNNQYKNLTYYKVPPEHRGLTKQRNYGIDKVGDGVDIVCFLDDDVVLEKTYFEKLISTYQVNQDAIAVGGYITNEVKWEQAFGNEKSKFYSDGWMRAKPFRLKVRGFLGLYPNVPPCFLPDFAHGLSIGFLPPSGKIYPAEFFMGGVSSYKKELFEKIQFSNYFDGYGLYEDLDFCLRVSKLGNLYVNTSARLQHYHAPAGRPNKFKYGKMIVRNSWYVWNVKYTKRTIKSILKFHSTILLLTAIRFTNIIKKSDIKEVLTEIVGRIAGWFSLFYNKPKIQ